MKERIELPLARLLHLLTQHPDLQWSNLEALQATAKFIELYVECVATAQNVSLLYTVVSKLKTVRMAGEEMDSTKLELLLNDAPLMEEDGDDARHSSPTYVSAI